MRVLDLNDTTIMHEKMIPWLVDQVVLTLETQEGHKVALDKMLREPSNTLMAKHATRLQQDRDRLQKIEDDKKRAEEEFQRGRAQRRERRRLLRLNRDKRGLKGYKLNQKFGYFFVIIYILKYIHAYL